ncbi:hypothetical protein VNO80_29491 [Phaseolus coccineus]|uniref:CCHC-type domain-containing protein n=1 Tax=Phaseolus coccineus TaxID=3886 RepID=A0AAN9QF28_PHACN
MESETQRKIEETVLDILNKSNMEEATEFTIRLTASDRLGIDLSDPTSKHFVRGIVESYLLSAMANGKAEKKENVVDEMEVMKLRREDPERVICHLSNRRNVAVKTFKGISLVSIREFYMKDGKLLPGSKGISLPSEQWSIFKKSVPAIEEAIIKMEGRIRSELNGKQNGDGSNSVPLEPVVPVPPLEPIAPIEVVRFDGKNFQFWAQQMTLLLKQLKIEYVLIEPCPNAALGEGAKAEDLVTAKAAERRWLNDDLVCCRNILSHLSDPLFNQYANRKMTSKELWEELNLVYLFEEFGTKRSIVKKYIEFQIVDEKTVSDQIRDLNGIADSIAASGIFMDDNFHVNVIISKLPPSWKNFCIKLLREEYLPFWKLMECIQIEEEFRCGVRRVGEHSDSVGFHQDNRGGGQRRVDYKPLGMCRNRPEINARSIPCNVCGKRGHLSKNCWRRSDKQTNERKAEEDVSAPTTEIGIVAATPTLTQ